MAAMTPREYCRRVVERSRSSFLPAFLFLRGAQREALYGVYAFFRAVDDAIDEHPPAEARVRLAALRKALDAALDGRSTYPPAVRFAEVAASLKLDTTLARRVVAALESDLEPARFVSLAQLRAYAESVAGDLGVLLLPVFGVRPETSPASVRYAHALGTALQLVNIVRDVGDDARRGRCYLPAEELARHGVTRAQLLARQDTPAMRAAIAAMRRLARTELTRARALLPRAHRDHLCVPEIMADLYGAQLDLLDQSQGQGQGQGQESAGSSGPFEPPPRVRRRAGLALATWRFAVSRVGRLSLPDAA